MRVGQQRKSELPGVDVADARIVTGREIERRLYDVAHAVDGCRFDSEGIAPVFEFARRQQRHRLGGERWRKMVADAGDIASKTATRGKMRGIGVERFVDGDRPAALDGAACERPCLVLRLPERQDALAV